jgi:hypothetical protein
MVEPEPRNAHGHPIERSQTRKDEPGAADAPGNPDRLRLLGQALEVLAQIVECAALEERTMPRRAQITYIMNHTEGSISFRNEGDKEVNETYVSYQTAAFGPKAEAHGNTFHQSINQPNATVDIPQLEQELAILMEALRTQADTPQHFTALAEVSSAEIATKGGDANKAMNHLRNAGQWAFRVAIELGCVLVAEIIKPALGL